MPTVCGGRAGGHQALAFVGREGWRHPQATALDPCRGPSPEPGARAEATLQKATLVGFHFFALFFSVYPFQAEAP